MSRVRPAKFVHVVYRTRRFEQMVRWYQTVFDARVQHRNPALAFLTYDDEHHRFAFVNLDVVMPGGPAEDRRGIVGVDHVSIGTDQFDSRGVVEDYTRWVHLVTAMLQGGFTAEEAGKIAGGNYMRIFREAVG